MIDGDQPSTVDRPPPRIQHTSSLQVAPTARPFIGRVAACFGGC
jgi:hypothetical protein